MASFAILRTSRFVAVESEVNAGMEGGERLSEFFGKVPSLIEDVS